MGARLVRGAVGGFVAGLVFIGVTLWFSSTQGNPPLMPFQLISTILLGAPAVQSGSASVPLGMAIHAVLSIVFGMVFALFVGNMRTNGTVALLATGYGLLLFLVNFVVLAPLLFRAFLNANYPFELFSHIVYGTLLGFAFYGSGVRSGEDVIAMGDSGTRTTGAGR